MASHQGAQSIALLFLFRERGARALTLPRARPLFCSQPKSSVKKVVVIVAHGIDLEIWEAHGATNAPALCRLLGRPVVVQARSATLVPGAPQPSLYMPACPDQVPHEYILALALAAAQTTHALLTLPANKKRQRDDAPPAPRCGAADGAGAPPSSGPAGPGASPLLAPTPKRLKTAAGEDVSHAAAAAPSGAAAAAAAAGEEGEAGALPPLSSYALTLDQLEEAGYPLPELGPDGEMACPAGYVATRSRRAGEPPAPALVALDCEMVTTAEGLELARVTVVDGQGRVALDMLVRPRNPVVDYNTRYSGIEAAQLAGVTARLEDAQAAVRGVVAAETLVVAHSGENDLRALKLVHAAVVDTALLFPHPRGPPARSALRVLAARFLRRSIQAGGAAGHDPVEDARAALDLALLKEARGPGFGVGGGERGERLADALGGAGRRGSLVGAMGVVSRYVGATFGAVVAEGDTEAAAAAAKEAARPAADFVWAQLGGVAAAHEARAAALKAAGAAAPCPEAYAAPEWAAAERAALGAVDATVAAAWAAAPAGTLFVVPTGQGDSAYQSMLEEARYARQPRDGEAAATAAAVGGLAAWGVADEEALRAAADRAITALCFVGLKE
jgi:RNA exonuclease 1